ncbi:2',3'-cyclic-nucleotide 3'-phosphodiesterase [Taphrina deformans PYCC 5710]|uniref:2',3'-cyclic-nucleotide 3'-phosphodiesterase n=1 Tax=Taphrina deformans (strain PYCC 5710 / ATCC 11124 / CBS 356.35 / IMI 108563 / JCM 9778 / NBRC 8474) TaxID=1097556 RepID=R4X7R1_TAPDE|nr:2',3'-cyclic-nucleotide 3'-phosphodiesterase [Taphrina deformans PYCC 5710]|eukprot:CCG81218.1 2',3'-cyclic-nucleotide 3'-phosphodiesterase [Taphrina deformans PYCC 5710]
MSGTGGSLWLVPTPGSACADELQSKIKDLSSNPEWGRGVSKPFTPHMTITSAITDYFLSSAEKVEFPGYSYIHLDEVKLAKPELRIKEIVFGDLFYKRIFIRLERTPSLLEVVSTLRSQFVGESQDALDEFMESFDPHISLAYASGFSEDEQLLEQVRASIETWAKSLALSEFQFIVLMDTRNKPKCADQDRVSDWKACPIRLAL